MMQEQKDIVRIESFWIDTWLKSQYQNIERKFIVHESVAKEVDEDLFFTISEGGGNSHFFCV